MDQAKFTGSSAATTAAIRIKAVMLTLTKEDLQDPIVAAAARYPVVDYSHLGARLSHAQAVQSKGLVKVNATRLKSVFSGFHFRLILRVFAINGQIALKNVAVKAAALVLMQLQTRFAEMEYVKLTKRLQHARLTVVEIVPVVTVVILSLTPTMMETT